MKKWIPSCKSWHFRDHTTYVDDVIDIVLEHIRGLSSLFAESTQMVNAHNRGLPVIVGPGLMCIIMLMGFAGFLFVGRGEDG